MNQTTNSANLTFTPHLKPMMTNAEVVETSFNIDINSPSQDSAKQDNLHLQTCKSFKVA